jgi:hypothetical protein
MKLREAADVISNVLGATMKKYIGKERKNLFKITFASLYKIDNLFRLYIHMKHFLPFFLLSVQILSGSTIKAQNAKVRSENEPAWVAMNNIDYTNKKLDGEAQDGYVDLSYDKQVSVALEAKYLRRAIKILTEAGVQNASEISVNFDPAYQSLTFHSVRIIRDGQSLNRLQLSKFKTIQEEKDLGMHLYDGSLTSLLVVEDVRKGDVLEYSYTIKGFNPMLCSSNKCNS